MIALELLGCMIASSFFSGLETGLLAADQLALYLKKETRVLHARAADFLLLKPERLLGTTLVGTNIAVVTASVLLASFLRRQGWSWASWVSSIGLSLVLLIFSEILPKSFFRRHADTISVRLAPVLVVFYFLFLPIIVILNSLINALLFLLGQAKRKSKLPQSREDLRLLVRLGMRESGLGRTDRRVFEEIFDFRDTLAREVMIPIHQHPVCRLEAPIRELIKLALDTDSRFIPIYRDRADNLIGYVDIEGLLSPEIEAIEQMMQKPVFYPDIKRIPELLLEMNVRKLDLAFLSDEYGAISGIITPGQIASEIVGFIPGGQTRTPQEIQTLAPGHFLVSGITDIENFRHETGISLQKGHYDTVGGFLCERLGKIPPVGKVHEEGGAIYKIVDRDERHIKRIEIKQKGRIVSKIKSE